MKKRIAKFITWTLVALCACAFAACSGKTAGMLSTKPNEGISAGVSESVTSYADTAYYEMERPADVKFAFETKKIQKISFKYNTLSGDDWSYKNDTVTVKKKVFADESAGDKRLRVFVDNQYVEITVRVVSKVVRTVDDFNSIRDNLNGAYVLGNDIDFANQSFWPIGKPVTFTSISYDSEGKPTYNYAAKAFEGVFDGMGHAIKNVTINARDRAEGEDGYGQGPSLSDAAGNGRNYSNGIFMSTSTNAKILNTDFQNITLNTQGLSGAVVGVNGGLIKNCRVSAQLSHSGYFEHSAGIAGINSGGDGAGRIENCIVVYSSSGGSRGIADWNSGVIRNCYAAVVDDYVLSPWYDSETKQEKDVDYNGWLTAYELNKNEEGWEEKLAHSFYNTQNLAIALGNHTLVALPGALDTNNITRYTYEANGDTALVPPGQENAGSPAFTATFYPGGTITNSLIVRKEFLLDPANFTAANGWDTEVWNFAYGSFPTLKLQSK